MKFPRIPFLAILAVPILLMLLGAASNQAVLIANWGAFPVMLNPAELAKMQNPLLSTAFVWRALAPLFSADMIDSVHCVMTARTHLNFLADYLNLGDGIYSPGDLLLLLGSWLWSMATPVWFALVVREYSKEWRYR